MRSKQALLFLAAFAISVAAYSQSLYHLQYNFHNPDDSITYHAFLFKNNPATGYFDPAGVIASEQNTVISVNTFFAAELIERAVLNKDFVLQFFSEDEDFFANLFNN